MTTPCPENPEQHSSLVEAVLREISVLLETFSASGEVGSIDLGGLPFSPRGREQLDTILGRGEIVATVDLAGRSEVWETGFAGVWRVRHFGAAEIAVDLVEITSCPEILRSDRRDVRLAAQRLAGTLDRNQAVNAEIAHEQ